MKPNPTIVMIGGLLGTPAMSALTFILAPVLGVHVDIVSLLAEVLGGWRTGMLVHVLNGVVIFPLIYAFLMYRFLPDTPLVKGTTFGVMLWLVSQTVVLPAMGAGLFSTHVGGIEAAAASLLGHAVYGSFLGSFEFLAQEESRSRSKPVISEDKCPWPASSLN
jgi:uncharacterized membrane protein YagU involved in acid resistance